jgi:hypothetical protein
MRGLSSLSSTSSSFPLPPQDPNLHSRAQQPRQKQLRSRQESMVPLFLVLERRTQPRERCQEVPQLRLANYFHRSHPTPCHKRETKSLENPILLI